jgi:hypothetical protein
MMTDCELMKQMFDNAEMEYVLETPTPIKGKEIVGQQMLRLKAKAKNVDGYADFVTEFHFDDNGKLLGAGIWE